MPQKDKQRENKEKVEKWLAEKGRKPGDKLEVVDEDVASPSTPRIKKEVEVL